MVDRIRVNGTELQYEVQGEGAPVVLLHCELFADTFAPLFETSLSDRYRLIRYHRSGYGGSARPRGPVGLQEQVEECRGLLEALDIGYAHVVGHSYGGTLALQLALDAPELVHSLAVLEPLVPAALTDAAMARSLTDTFERALAQYRAGDPATAVETWARGIFGLGCHEELERALPGAFEQAIEDADALFRIEAPALQRWRFSREDAARIEKPVLSIFHEDPEWPGFWMAHERLLGWLPRAEASMLPNADHLLHVVNPLGTAEALAGFFERHRLSGFESPGAFVP